MLGGAVALGCPTDEAWLLGATVRGMLGALGRADTEGLGATVTLGVLRLGVETTGGRAERMLKSLLGPRL